MAERDLGTLPGDGTPEVRSGRVNNGDRIDTFSFRLENPGNINMALTGMNDNANFRLFRDVNGDGDIDGGDREIQSSSYGGNHDEEITVANQEAGAYLIEVTQGDRGVNTRYDLSVSTTPFRAPSNLLPIETEVGSLRNTRNYRDRVGVTDTSDIYRFRLERTSDFSLLLDGLSNDADVRLIRDNNGNRGVDSGEVLAISAFGGTTPDQIGISNLAAGNYYVQVYQYSGDTDYTLSLSPSLDLASSSDASRMSLFTAK
jgi:hypothetical protein